MKSIISIHLLMFITLLSCNSATNRLNQPEYIDYVHEIMSDYVQEATHKYNLKCSGSGGSMPFDVMSIRIAFYKEHNFTSLEEARKTLIELVHLLSEKVHQHKKIQPFLHERPFPLSGSQVSISIKNEEYDNGKPTDELVFLFQKAGSFFYSSYDGKMLISKFQETYEEAVKKNQEYLKKKEGITSSSTE